MAIELNDQIGLINTDKKDNGPVVCLGKTFENDKARRTYFTEELRKRLTELRKIEGFPIGEGGDILALSDPPYYTVCPNPFIPEFIEQWAKEKKMYGEEEEYHREPFASDVSEGKNDPVYNAHSYHTKVPHKAIMRYILHYTKPGDIIFDGFCGTGMTGVAASLCGDERSILSIGYKLKEGSIYDEDDNKISEPGFRKAILNDLSPAAAFIAYNYTNPIDVIAFQKSSNALINKVEKEINWMYETIHISNQKKINEHGTNILYGKINYVVWSDVFTCPNCSNEVVFTDTAVDLQLGKVNEEFFCNNCKAKLSKTSIDRAWNIFYDPTTKMPVRQAKQVPVLISYIYNGKKYVKKPDIQDLNLIKKIEDYDISCWYPSYRMPEGDESRRNDRSGITHVHHFYTKRNLIALSILHKEISLSEFSLPLKLAFQSIAATLVSKLVRYNMGNRGNGTLAGTLYMSSMTAETEILKVFKGKMADFSKAFLVKNKNTVISVQSSESLAIPDDSIDYIFIDPPFGANIMYSELNFIWEAWLKCFTNNKGEAVVSKTQQKELSEYQSIILSCFVNFFRVLKPGRWMTVEFSNSQASVWNAIQESIQRAGFVIANVSALDKQQGSFKAVTTTTAVKQDLVISAYKPTAEMNKAMIISKNSEGSAWAFVRNHLQQLPVFIGEKGLADIIVERTPRVLFDRMVAYHVQNGYSVPISSAEFQASVAQRFPMRDGMVFLENQVAEYDKKRILAKEFIQMSLFVSDENSAIEWLRQQLLKKPQTRQDIYTGYVKEIQHISKYEKLPELDVLLEQNFLQYDGNGPVPSQIHAYLSTNFKDLRELDKEDPSLRAKAKERWYVPDPNKQADLEKLREKSLMREFAAYVDEINRTKKKLKQFRLEAIRAGFKKAWGDKDYKTIVDVGSKIPENVLQEDDKLLMYYDNAQIRLEA